MKKSNVGLIAGIGIGLAAGVVLSYTSKPKYVYFDRKTLNRAKEVANKFLNALNTEFDSLEMIKRRQAQLVSDYVVNNAVYQEYSIKMLEQLSSYQVEYSPAYQVKECLYLIKNHSLLLNGRPFYGYKIHLGNQRLLSDSLIPKKEELMNHVVFSEGDYEGCYGVVLNFKINQLDWYIRLAYIEYDFKVLDFGLMNGRYKSFLL